MKFPKCYFCKKTVWVPLLSSSYHHKCFDKKLDELSDLAFKLVWSDLDKIEKEKRLDEIYSELNLLAKL